MALSFITSKLKVSGNCWVVVGLDAGGRTIQGRTSFEVILRKAGQFQVCWHALLKAVNDLRQSWHQRHMQAKESAGDDINCHPQIELLSLRAIRQRLIRKRSFFSLLAQPGAAESVHAD